MLVTVGFFLVSQALDVLTTLIGVSRGAVEGNPIATNMGLPFLLLLKILAAPLAIGLACWGEKKLGHNCGKWGLVSASGITMIAVVNNIIQIP